MNRHIRRAQEPTQDSDQKHFNLKTQNRHFTKNMQIFGSKRMIHKSAVSVFQTKREAPAELHSFVSLILTGSEIYAHIIKKQVLHCIRTNRAHNSNYKAHRPQKYFPSPSTKRRTTARILTFFTNKRHNLHIMHSIPNLKRPEACVDSTF